MAKERLNKLPQNTKEVEEMLRDLVNKCKNAKPEEKFSIVECPCEYEDKSIEIIQSEEQRERIELK